MPVAANADEIGSFGDLISWPIIGLHVAMTPDGKLLTFGTDLNGQQTGLHIYDVWDPVTGEHTTLTHTTNSDIFCAVGIIDPTTGEILIAGGDARPAGAYNAGIADVNVFDYRDLSLDHSPTGAMAFARWYATAVQTGSGQIVMIGGRDGSPPPDFKNSPYPEIYTAGYGFRTLTGAYIDDLNSAALYPRSWLTSKGDIWTITEGTGQVYSINTEGSGSVEHLGGLPAPMSWLVPAVMYAPDKVLMVSDNGTAWILDMSGDVPVWEQTGDVGANRKWANLTVLPDGRVMISGGSAVDNQLIDVATTVEIWDPATGDWSIEADAAVPRLYHSGAILLATGQVLTLAGGAPGPVANLNAEMYSPDYLFDAGGVDAERPVIVDAPDVLSVGDDFQIEVEGDNPITTLALMKFGSVTHSFDVSSQRIELAFTVGPDGKLVVELPDNPNVLTSGYWMLFAIDSSGSISVAPTIKIESEVPFDQPSQLPLDLGVKMNTTGAAAYDLYDDSYALTPNAAVKAGAAMSAQMVDLSKAFSITFEINAGADDNSADGLAFVLHNDARGAAAIGYAGAAFGAIGIENGIAIAFDTYYNPAHATDIANDNTFFLNTGSGEELTARTDLGNIEDGAWHQVTVAWDGTTLTYSMGGAVIASLDEDAVTEMLGGSQYAYFGFTGGTGGAHALHKARVVTLDATLQDGDVISADRADLPRPPTFVISGDATYDATLDKFVLTSDEQLQHGGVMTEERIDLSSPFKLTFSFNLGDKDANGADGMAFVMHNDPLGNQALGGLGGAMGALNIQNGLAIQLDTYQNEGDLNDIANDHTSFISTGTEQMLSPVVDLGNIEDGNWHTLRLFWDGESLAYTLDGAFMGRVPAAVVTEMLGGSNFAYLGITASTGGMSQLAQVRIDNLDAVSEDGSTLHILGPNAVPVAVDDNYEMTAGGSLTVNAANGVLANDNDPDGNAIKVIDQAREAHHEVLLSPRNGTVVMNEDGSFTYTPNAGFVGVDTFYYAVADRWACCEGKVTINVAGSDAQAISFVTNGAAAVVDTVSHAFQVVPDEALSHGSVMSAERISIASAFSLTMQIYLGTKDAAGADGMAFVLHNDPLGDQALGGLGGAMGALNIQNGLAIQFDTYQNESDANDIANDHTSFISTGTEEVLSPVVDLGNIEDGNWHTVSLVWDGNTLSYTFDGEAAGTFTGDLSALLGGEQYAYFGVTGATGGLSNDGQVRFVSLEATSEAGHALSLVTTTGGIGLNPIVGDGASNVITGTAGHDLILGMAGDDVIDGGAGNDTISGGIGNDILSGGAGSDTFVFSPGFGYDTIKDFGDGIAGNIDLIDFSAFGMSAIEALTHAFGDGTTTVFNFGNGDVLFVENTAAGNVTNLTAQDLIV